MGFETNWRCDACKDTAAHDDVGDWSRVTIAPLMPQNMPPITPEGMPMPVGAITPGVESQGVPALEPPETTTKVICHKPSCLTKVAKEHNDGKGK